MQRQGKSECNLLKRMKRQRIMQHDTRYLFLSMTISGVACFLFFRFAYPYHLLHREQMLLFTYTVDQFIDYFNHPAPLSCLGGDFLTQFFHNINMGAAVVALTMAALGTLTYFTCRKWTNRWIAIGISIVVLHNSASASRRKG